MAKYRAIYTKLWSDPDFQDYNKDQKLLFIYLCTNPYTSESGIYNITFRTINNDLDIGLETVSKLLENGNLKNVHYDFENKFVFVKNFRRYNAGGEPELMKKCIKNEYLNSSCTPLWQEFVKTYPKFEESIKEVSIDIVKDITITKDNGNGNDPIPNGSKTVVAERDKGIDNGSKTDNQPLDSKPTIYDLYEQNIGIITSVIADELKVIEENYKYEWFAEALKIAVENNARKLVYIKSILERWNRDGYKVDTRIKKTKNKEIIMPLSKTADDIRLQEGR